VPTYQREFTFAKNAVLCLFFLYIHPNIANQSRKTPHTAMRHDCLHGMPRFHITLAKMAIL